MIMKYLKHILMLSAAVLAFSCTPDGPDSVADNNFKFECDAPDVVGAPVVWAPGSSAEVPDTLKFGWESASADVDVVHAASSNEWSIRCELDASWCTYATDIDVLTVTVAANITTAVRRSFVDVQMGENSKRIIIEQGHYSRTESELPETGWDDEEDEWTETAK